MPSPLTLRASTTVKARVYRIGTSGNASAERFIDISPVAECAIRKVVPKEADLPLPEAGQPPKGEGWKRGVNYRIYHCSQHGRRNRNAQFLQAVFPF